MTVPVWLDQASKIEEEFDVAVVGAGIVGASAAYWLGKRRGLATVVVDADRKGGSTVRSAGFVLRGTGAHYNQAVRKYGREVAAWILRMNEESLRTLGEVVRGRESSLGYRKCGSYLLACSLEELQDLEESATLMREDLFELEFLPGDPLDRGFYGAIHNPDDACVSPGALVDLLLALSGATVYDGEEVFRIESSNNRVTIHTPGRVIRASRVLVLLNAFLPSLVPQLSSMLDIVRGQALVTRPLKETVVDKLCYANYGFEYFRQLTDGRFLLGGCREAFTDEERGYGDFVTTTIQTALNSYMRDRFPEIAGSVVDYRWSGLMAFTRDGLPLIGEIDDRPGVFFATGCNGHGLCYGISLAKILIDVSLDDADAGIFAASRESLRTEPRSA